MKTPFPLILLCSVFSLVTACHNNAANTAAKPRSSAGPDGRPSIDLSGQWEFKLDPLDVGRAEKWFDPRTPYDRNIQVPGAWNAQDVSFTSEEQLREYERQRLDEQKALNKLGILGVQRESDRLFHVYPGPGWYRRKLTIPRDWNGKIPWLVFAGVHREAEVWVQGKPAGAHHSYLTPFQIDLSPFAKAGDTVTVAVRVDARRNRDVDPLLGCLDTLDFLYITWGGIYEPVKLEATSPTRITDVFAVPRLADDTAEIRATIDGPGSGKLAVGAEILDADGASVASVRRPVEGGATEIALPARIAQPRLWSPKTPHLYTARVRLFDNGAVIDRRDVRFGMREFKAADGKFLLNGRPIFLRGYGDDCIFPNTICPPADKEALRARLARARDYGFNFVRHHSWTPPEPYLEAADELGMMLQPEFPFAYNWDIPKTPEAKRMALEQWEAVIRLNRNHPSIVSWCMGNEQYEAFDFARQMYDAAKRLDPTRLVIDSDGVSMSKKDRPTLDYLVAFFNEGSSIGFQDGKYNVPSGLGKPVIAHEMGYFVTLHDLGQMDLFQAGLRPYWLFQTRDLAEKNGALDAYPAWLSASYHLQAACLKNNIETARRSPLAGTAVWLFQDYPNCAEGVVDMFGRPKGLTAGQFRAFNSPTVLLLDVPRRSWWGGEIAEIKFVVSRFEDEPSEAATFRWNLTSDEGGIIAEGERKNLAIQSGGIQELPAFKIPMPEQAHAAKLTLSAELSDASGKSSNSWSLWAFPHTPRTNAASEVLEAGFEALRDVYPEAGELKDGAVPPDTRLLVTTRLGSDERAYLDGGGRILLLDPEPAFAVEKTNFRLSSWDGGGPSGTIVDVKHPALRGIPTDGWCDLQFYPLIQNSKTVLLTAMSARIEPLVRCIDRPTRLAPRAYLFEAAMGRGKLLVSGFNFAGALAKKDPAGTFLLDQLVRYAIGPEFNPKSALAMTDLQTKAAK